MRNGDGIHEKYQMVHDIKYLVGNCMSLKRGNTDQHEQSNDSIACSHDFCCELVTKGVFTGGTHVTEKDKEKERCHRHETDDQITQVIVHGLYSLHW